MVSWSEVATMICPPPGSAEARTLNSGPPTVTAGAVKNALLPLATAGAFRPPTCSGSLGLCCTPLVPTAGLMLTTLSEPSRNSTKVPGASAANVS